MVIVQTQVRDYEQNVRDRGRIIYSQFKLIYYIPINYLSSV